MKKKILKTRKLIPLVLSTGLLTLVACGHDDKNDSSSGLVQAAKQQQLQQENIGVYRATLSQLNSNVAGSTNGIVTVTIEGDQFIVQESINGAAAGVRHLQHISVGTACPLVTADTNNDGVIDVAEEVVASGEILIPLDSNLNSQIQGMSFGPVANSIGGFVYRRRASFSRLLADLRAVDGDAHDNIVKLPLGEELNLSGKAVIVHGVQAKTILPTTTAILSGASAQESLPIACGLLMRVNE